MGAIQSQTTYSLSEIQNHSSDDNTWIVYDNKVYDVTEILHNFDKKTRELYIKNFGGKDITSYFNNLKKMKSMMSFLSPLGKVTDHANTTLIDIIDDDFTLVLSEKKTDIKQNKNLLLEEIKYNKNTIMKLLQEQEEKQQKLLDLQNMYDELMAENNLRKQKHIQLQNINKILFEDKQMYENENHELTQKNAKLKTDIESSKNSYDELHEKNNKLEKNVITYEDLYFSSEYKYNELSIDNNNISSKNDILEIESSDKDIEIINLKCQLMEEHDKPVKKQKTSVDVSTQYNLVKYDISTQVNKCPEDNRCKHYIISKLLFTACICLFTSNIYNVFF